MKTGSKLLAAAGTALILAASFSGCKFLPKEEAVVAPALIEPPKITYKTVKAEKASISKSIAVQGRFISVKQYDYAFTMRSGYIKSINFKAGDTVKKGDVLAELDSDNSESQVQLAEIRVKKAELAYNKVNSNPAASDFDKQQAALDLQSERIILQNLRKELSKTRLISTVSGKVAFAADVKIGQLVTANQPIFTVVDPNSLQLESVDSNASEFKLGMKVNIKYGSETFTGEVVTTSENLPKNENDNKNTDKPLIRVKLDKIPSGAKLGDPVNISIELERKDNAIIIPSTLVRKYEGASYVQLLENNTKIERFVETGIDNGEKIEITKGVTEGDQVIQE